MSVLASGNHLSSEGYAARPLSAPPSTTTTVNNISSGNGSGSGTVSNSHVFDTNNSSNNSSFINQKPIIPNVVACDTASTVAANTYTLSTANSDQQVNGKY